MGLKTVDWSRVVDLVGAKTGVDFRDKELVRASALINSAAQYIFDESRYHPRFLVLEPRTQSRGYIQPTEDSYNVYGAGTSEANGLYVRNGSSSSGVPIYTMSDESSELFRLGPTEPSIEVSGAGNSPVPETYFESGTLNGKTSYELDSDNTKVIQWSFGGQWIIADSLGVRYTSDDDVATPDLATTWEVDPLGGIPPAPTVEAVAAGWRITNLDTNAVEYSNDSTGATPPESGWITAAGEDPTPIVQALSEIDEIISYWDGARWVGANPSEVAGYPDQNGFRLTSTPSDVVYVAYKKVLPTEYGDGNQGTTSDFPAEWLNYCAYSAAREWMGSVRRDEAFNPVSLRDVDKREAQVLIKANRQGAFDTIANIWTTRYAKDTSIASRGTGRVFRV